MSNIAHPWWRRGGGAVTKVCGRTRRHTACVLVIACHLGYIPPLPHWTDDSSDSPINNRNPFTRGSANARVAKGVSYKRCDVSRRRLTEYREARQVYTFIWRVLRWRACAMFVCDHVKLIDPVRLYRSSSAYTICKCSAAICV